MLERFTDYELIEDEELLRRAADHPALSAGLRERVIAAVLRARRIDAIRRRVCLSVCCLLAFVGFLASQQTLVSPLRASVMAADTTGAADDSVSPMYRKPTPFTGPAELMAMSEVGDWGHVEAVLRFRAVRRDKVFHAFARF